MALKSGCAISGSSSTSTVNSRSAGSAAGAKGLVTSTLGCIAARRPRSDSTRWVASLTLSSSTSAITAAP